MKAKNNKEWVKKYYKETPDFDDFKAVSSQDCTGLVPSAPQSKADKESYKQTYDYGALAKDK